jgi:hypothetical protein
MTPGPPAEGGPPERGGPPSHVDLPDAVPQRVRERILTGRTERRATGDDEMGEML